jgi:hypothetical protein
MIEFDFGSDKDPPFHRVLNFNDSLLYLARGEEWMSFSLDQIDKSTGQGVHVKSARKLRRVLARIEKLVEEHGFKGIARLTVIGQRFEANG